ncbi:hypothetical protein CRG98_022385 [Punica granatum]|uniref:Uncharacterized protein n=1 Tax=Punica granatum TaxID=22663 RepID=A0A2I0JMS4_PUNGR|nr:hypothetical protein CRG98_022385 [Punica granatum]
MDLRKRGGCGSPGAGRHHLRRARRCHQRLIRLRVKPMSLGWKDFEPVMMNCTFPPDRLREHVPSNFNRPCKDWCYAFSMNRRQGYMSGM